MSLKKNINPIVVAVITCLLTAVLSASSWMALNYGDLVKRKDLVEYVGTSTPYLKEKEGITIRIAENRVKIDSLEGTLDKLLESQHSQELTLKGILVELRHINRIDEEK